MIPSLRTCLIGIGNPDRGDDGLGIHVARSCRASLPGEISIRECSGDPSQLLGIWQAYDRVIIVDASSPQGTPGSIRRFDAAHAPLPAALRHRSTHGLGVAEAIEIGRTLGRLPQQVVVFAVEGSRFNLGCGLSPEVSGGVERAVAMILEELST